MLKAACERRLVKYERRFGSQQGANYRVGKYRYLNRELRERLNGLLARTFEDLEARAPTTVPGVLR
jgi:hypothetical protein